MSRALRKLGRQVARHQDDTPPQLDTERGMARFRVEVDRSHLRPRRTAYPAIALAVACVALVVGFFWPRPPLTVRLQDGSDAESWIEGAADAHFSDGSLVEAQPRSRWRVATRTARGATIQLERGGLTAHVVHRDDTSWQVDAGPFAIRVTGTAFTTRWDPAEQIFELTMLDGTVVLSGPVVGGRREVAAPERLRVQLEPRRLSILSPEPPSAAVATIETPTAGAPSPPTAPAEASANPPPTEAPRSSSEPSPAQAARSATTTTDAVSWNEHARARRYPEALAELHRIGADAVVGRASPSDLLLIAQTARLGGDAALAERALSQLHDHHPDSVQARTALFLAGRMQFDRGQHPAAIASLGAYLSTSPNGAFASEAQVLLILALHRSGRIDEARQRASLYLQRHPTGPQADRLQSILEP